MEVSRKIFSGGVKKDFTCVGADTCVLKDLICDSIEILRTHLPSASHFGMLK